jgi:S-formylglutathione hydrolase FrmB
MFRMIRPGFGWLGFAVLALASRAAELSRFELASEFLKSPVMVEVLVPDGVAAGERLPVVYVLAAEPRADGNRGLAEIQRLGLADTHRVICVGVNFDTMPWYGDHATDPGLRHESHIVRRLVPEVDRRFPTRGERDGRWLIGFSKSGWGAFTLLFRNPETFGFAASWDAPLLFTLADFGTYKTGPHFGTPENFAQYLPAELAQSRAAPFRDRPRLVLAGSALFGGEPDNRFAATPHTEAMHRLLDELAIPHCYDPDLRFAHRWNSGWLEPTLAHLVGMARAGEKTSASVNLSNAGALARP